MGPAPSIAPSVMTGQNSDEETMMRAARLCWSATGLVMLVAMSACFLFNRSSAPAQGDAVFVYVANDLIAPSQVTVQLIADGGDKVTLGLVPPAAHQMLNVAPAPRTGQVRLQALARGAPNIVSPPFALANAAAVSWDLRTNALQLVPRAPR